MATNIKGPKEKLGEEKYQEVIEKDWKVAPLPTEEELAEEEPTSPKARNNLNSRRNLAQYNKKSKQTKKKIVDNLQFVETEEDLDPYTLFEDHTILNIIEKISPAREVLADRSEQEVYYNYIKMILEDFDADDLTSSDIDDIATLARNKVIELRLMKLGAKSPIRVLEAMPTIEKLSKASEKIKSNLASRRVDRIDVKNRPAFSIVDLAAHLDNNDKLDFERRMKELERERDEFKPPLRDERGNLIPDE